MTCDYHIPAALWEASALIREATPNNIHAVPYGSWKRHLPNHAADVRWLEREFPNGISRAGVVQCAPELQKLTFSKMRRLFIATMMWAYGDTIHYGPYRTSIMLDDPGLKEKLTGACGHILNGNLQAAVDDYSIQRCGMSYFTKFLYFVGRAYRIRPRPLILDSYVLDELYCRRARRFVKHIAWHDKGKNGFVRNFRAYKDGYTLYVEGIHCWARHFKVRPDKLEFFLFDENRKRRSQNITTPVIPA